MNTSTVTLATIPALLALYLPTPVQIVLFGLLFVLIGFDFITGCMKSYKAKKPITSNAMGKTVNKMVAYFGLTLISFAVAFIAKEVLEIGIIADSFVALVLAFCNIRESYSILENLGKLGIKLPKFLINLMRTMEDQIEGDNTEE